MWANKKLTWIGFLLSLLLAWIVTFIYLENRTDIAIESRLKEQTATQNVAWQAAINTHSHTIETYFEQLINKPYVIDIMARAQDPNQRDQARLDLAQKLDKTYQYLEQKGVRQFHFHLPNNDSFYRFHHPDKHGDNLSEIRYSVKWVNENKQAYSGFETGKVVSGFRYVFPITSPDNTHLGSVEISLPFERIRKEVSELQPEREFRMVIYNENLLSQLFSSQVSLYSAWRVNERFLIEDSQNILSDSARPLSQNNRALNEYLRNDPYVQQILQTGDSGSVAFFYQQQPYSVTFTAIYDTRNILTGYLVGYRPAPELLMARTNYLASLASTTFIILLLGVFGILWLRRHQQYRQEQDRLKTIYDTMGEGLYVMDQQGYITHYNRKAAQMLGYNETELLGQVAHYVFHYHQHNEQLPLNECPIYQAISSRQVYDGVQIFRRSNGEFFTAKVISHPLFKDDKLIGSVTSFMDISQEQRIADDLKEAKIKAEQANQAKSEFLANMSHEIRTPLNAVIGLGQLLMDSPLSTQQRNYLTKMNQSSTLLLSIINDILDYSKIEAGKLEIAPQAFYINDVCQQIRTLFQDSAHQKGLGLVVQIDPQVPTTLFGDDLRLAQVLTNLMSNAIKFTPNGEVRLNIQLVEQQSQSAIVEFAVCDTGIGLSAQQINRLFQPFTQADSSTTRKYGGTGLGLVICQRLIQAMGGELLIDSQPNNGACFSFRLNLNVTDITPAQDHRLMDTQQVWSEVGFSGHLLLAEDNAINQMVASQLLQRIGFHVTVVDNGQQAVEAMTKQHFDGILMDLQMPVMSGYEATIKIRETNPDIPIIALTAAALVEDRHKVLAAGMNDHLAKPIELNKLHATLVHWLGHLQIKTNPTGDTTHNDDQILAQLKHALNGFDVELALKRLQGDTQLYLQILSQFYQDLPQDKTLMQAELSPIRLHSIKGIAGNLGAMRLHNASAQLEQALSQTGEQRQQAELVFWQAFEEVQTSLTQCAALFSVEHSSNYAETIEEPAHINKTLVSVLMQKLKQGDLLTKHETAKLSAWASTKMPPEQSQALRQALLKLDYVLAVELIEPYL